MIRMSREVRTAASATRPTSRLSRHPGGADGLTAALAELDPA